MATFSRQTVLRGALFVSLLGVELWLARGLTQRRDCQGYVLSKSYAVSPSLEARVKSVAVVVGAQVKAGEVLAQLDTSELDRELELANAERDRLEAEVAVEMSTAQRDQASTLSSLAQGTEAAAADLANANASLQATAGELAAVEAAIAEQRDLVDKQVASNGTLNELKLRQGALQKQVASYRNVISVLQSNLAASSKRGKTVVAAPQSWAPVQAELAAVEVRITQLKSQREALALRAPVDGVVGQLLLSPGELAGPQLPLTHVIVEDATRVVACIPEYFDKAVGVGSEATSQSLVGADTAVGVVESITSNIDLLPARCQPTATSRNLGRVAVVLLDAPRAGNPGQSQRVSFAAARRKPTSPKPNADSSSTPASKPVAANQIAAIDAKGNQVVGALINLPADLAARTRFEPSGLVWFNDRFLVISDDTGQKDDHEHAPWLFSVASSGEISSEPVVVQGIAEIQDLEAIAQDDGGLWLLSSQSLNKKGKRKPARQMLVRVVSQNGQLVATQSVALASLLASMPAAARQALGLGADPALASLDIEGVASRGGALYLGVKAPLADRHAMVLRVANPQKLLAGDVAGAGVTRWATFAMSVFADGGQRPGGVSDMLFLDDNTLLVTATASGIDPSSQTSSLFRIERPSNQPATSSAIASATLVWTFPNLGAEGLALPPGADAVTVVFDRGAQAGAMVKLPVASVLGAK